MIAEQLLNALLLGTTYALLAIGYTLVFGVLNMLNFAHPTVFALGGFFLFTALAALHLPLVLAALVVVVAGIVFGYATELFCFRLPARRGDELTPAITSVAFSLVLTEVIAKVWGAEPVRIPSFPEATYRLGGLQISTTQIAILVASVALMIAVDFLLQRTRTGYALRAIAERREVSQLLGVNVRSTVVFAFALSGVLATLAGMLLTMRVGLADPNVSLTYGLRALAIMVIGGLGNVRGAMLAGLLVGFADVMTLAFLSQAYSGVAAWVLLIVVLLLRPSGLMGTRLQRESI